MVDCSGSRHGRATVARLEPRVMMDIGVERARLSFRTGRDTVCTHVDTFIEKGPGLMQPIIECSVGRAEGPTAFLATVASTFVLRGDIEGMANDVAFAGLSTQRTIGVGTGAR